MNGFVSYAHDDAREFSALRRHLKALKRGFSLALWTDHKIAAGTVWEAAIADAIADAQVFVLLLSPSFIESDYVFEKELPAIRDRRKSGGALVLPVVVKRCQWQWIVGQLQAVPMTDEGRLRPITEWKPQDHGCDRATHQMAAAIAKHFGRPPTHLDWGAA
jgi:hypothetical protein